MHKRILGLFIVITLVIAIICFCTPEKNEIEAEEITTDNEYINVTYDEEQDVFEEDILGTLVIEKIGLRASVKEGSNSDILKTYIGHIEETAVYDGNVGLAAHNRGNEFSYFARLNELKEGDEVTYTTKYGTRSYRVNKIEVILETDWTNLENTAENVLTMITCIANRPSQRLCVQAVQF